MIAVLITVLALAGLTAASAMPAGAPDGKTRAVQDTGDGLQDIFSVFDGSFEIYDAYEEAPYEHITPQEAMTMMREAEDFAVVDVRDAEEYAKGHIPNAINLPLEQILREETAELPYPEQLLLIYCSNDVCSRQAAQKLFSLGYENAYEFGGISYWPGELTSPAGEDCGCGR